MIKFAASLLFFFFWVSNLQAQAPFYKGKTIRIIVGGSAGGGFDTYSRAIARHMAKHIPGNPTLVVENMTGAATRIAAKSDEARQLIKAGAINPSTITRVYVTTPGTPKERVQIPRKAFQDTLRDPEFVAEAKKANLEIDPLTGEEVEKIVAELFNISPSTVSKLAAVLAVK